MKFLSPLRYPGGKAKMGPFLERLIDCQPERPNVYAEPFAGGAGAAFHLLTEEVVERIALNDLNDGIAAFWSAVFFDTERLVAAVAKAEPTLRAWYQHREIYLDDQAEAFDRGLATFFLNRTNRSGILGARPIGGMDQAGTWKIDARFNRQKLIEYLATFRGRVSVSQLNGEDFLRELDSQDQETLFYVDPPYIKQGEDLYLANMTYRDHLDLARTLRTLKSPWVLTYDHDARVPDERYAGLPCASFSVSHTAARQHIGREYLVVPQAVRVDSLEGFGPRLGVWLERRSPADFVATGRRH